MTTTKAVTAGSLEHMDPHTLIVETNVRTVAPLDDGFVASIRENGVLTPILAWPDADGGVQVRAGQRRTLAAREAGVATVPVYVVDASDEDTARRIIEQLIENDQREALTDADRIQAWRALELEGLSATAIAKRTGTKRDRVKTGLAVAANGTATALLQGEGGLTLDQAATLLEFDGDAETVSDLSDIAVSDPGYFPVAVERARQEKAAREAKEKVEREEAAKGHRIVDERPTWGDAPHPVRILRTADGNPVEVEAIQGKAGVAVYVGTYYGGQARAEYFVDDPAALGYTVREAAYSGSTPAAQSGPMTEEQKAERKQLIARNKEWDAAETVRREWVAQFLARKTLPKNTQTVIATGFANATWRIADGVRGGSATAKTFLGIGDQHDRDALGEYLTAHPNRATHVTLAVVLGGIEGNTDRNTWRNPTADTAWYLRTLQDWGYTLCSVERIAAMLTDADTEAEAVTEAA